MITARTPPIRGIIEASLLHWPGRIASVIYLSGCTLKCPSCPAPHLIGWSESGATIPVEAVLDALYKRRRWIEGVVVKGGEPFAHPELFDLLDLMRDFRLDVRVDTNGTRPVALESAMRRGLVDEVSMDVKAPLIDRYSEVAGTPVALGSLFESIELLLSGDVEYEFCTAVGKSGPTDDEVLGIARTIRGAARYVLRTVSGEGPSRSRLRRLARRAGRYVKACYLQGEQPRAEPGDDRWALFGGA